MCIRCRRYDEDDGHDDVHDDDDDDHHYYRYDLHVFLPIP